MNEPIVIRPKCEADRKKCKALVRIYKQHLPENVLTIENDRISHEIKFYAHFIDEVEARCYEKYQGDYRISFFSEKANLKFDSWFNSYAPYVQHYEGYLMVLRFEAPAEFKSVCI